MCNGRPYFSQDIRESFNIYIALYIVNILNTLIIVMRQRNSVRQN